MADFEFSFGNRFDILDENVNDCEDIKFGGGSNYELLEAEVMQMVNDISHKVDDEILERQEEDKKLNDRIDSINIDLGTDIESIKEIISKHINNISYNEKSNMLIYTLENGTKVNLLKVYSTKNVDDIIEDLKTKEINKLKESVSEINDNITTINETKSKVVLLQQTLSNWQLNSFPPEGYEDYSHKCVISDPILIDCTTLYVTYGNAQASSGNYASTSVLDNEIGTLTLYSNMNESINVSITVFTK